ncbi:MAG: hypothetical protein ABI960_01350 [Candidatus Eisenbacteria bacterium]
MNPFAKLLDERFLEHRRRSTSVAGMLGGTVAMGLFVYRVVVDHVWSWDLLSVGIVMALTKVSLMAWYSKSD